MAMNLGQTLEVSRQLYELIPSVQQQQQQQQQLGVAQVVVLLSVVV
jgi:hypothetical protein